MSTYTHTHILHTFTHTHMLAALTFLHHGVSTMAPNYLILQVSLYFYLHMYLYLYLQLQLHMYLYLHLHLYVCTSRRFDCPPLFVLVLQLQKL